MKKIIRITTVPSSMRVLLKGQLRFISQYYDVIAVSSDGDCFDDMLKEQGVRGIKVNMTRKITPFRDLIALFKLIFIFIKEKPFIVHTHTPKAGILAMLAACLCRVPHRLHTVAGLPLLETRGLKRLLLNFVEMTTYAAATKVLPNSLNLKTIIEQNIYINKKKLSVIGFGSSNGIDLEYFSKEATLEGENIEIYNKYLNRDIITFCFVGRVVKDKGVNELVSAFIRLYNIEKKVRLLIVGKFEETLDPVLPWIKKEIYEHEAIKYVGYQNDIRPYLMVSDVFVLPTYREGFPNVVMQAGAMELPCLVTDINGCNEIIINGKNGVLIPAKNEDALYDKMLWFLGNDFSNMKKCSRSMIKDRYEQQIFWKNILDLYFHLK